MASGEAEIRLLTPVALFFVAALVAGLALAAPPAPSVHAEIEGDCNAAIGGTSLRDTDSGDPDTAIDVEEGESVTVSMASSAGFASHKVLLEFAGIRIATDEDTDDGDLEWTETVNVDDYATYGVGLYKVIGEATLVDGSTCTGAALVNVKGSPLGAVAGIAALVAMVLGGAALLLSAFGSQVEGVRARRRIRAWLQDQLARIDRGEMAVDMGAFKGAVGKAPIFPLWLIASLPALLLMGSIPGGGGGGASIGGIRLPRASFRPKVPLLGSIGAIFFAEGFIVMLQQYAVQPLTQSSAIIGLAVGMGLAILLPTAMRLWNNVETNRAVADAEARINAAIDARLKAAGLPNQPPPPPPTTPPSA